MSWKSLGWISEKECRWWQGMERPMCCHFCNFRLRWSKARLTTHTSRDKYTSCPQVIKLSFGFQEGDIFISILQAVRIGFACWLTPRPQSYQSSGLLPASFKFCFPLWADIVPTNICTAEGWYYMVFTTKRAHFHLRSLPLVVDVDRIGTLGELNISCSAIKAAHLRIIVVKGFPSIQ